MDYEGLLEDLRMMLLNAEIKSTNAAFNGDMKRSFQIFNFELECRAFRDELRERGYGG